MSWRIEFAHALTDQTVGIFDCEIGRLSKYIGKNGVLEGSIPISNRQVGSNLSRVIGGEGRTTMYAYHREQVWWGGFLDNTHVLGGLGGARLDFHGASFEAYPDRREARTNETITQVEQTQIAKIIWDLMQDSGPGSDVLVDTSQATLSTGKRRDMSWKRSEARTYGSILKEVSNREGGFEWLVDVVGDGTQRKRLLKTGFPRVGRPESGLTLTYPGAILAYELEGDALDGATSFQSRGQAPDPVGSPNPDGDASTAKGSPAREPIMSDEFNADDLHRLGYVRTDATIERSTVKLKSTLDAWASMGRETRSGPLVLPSVLAYMDGLNQSVLGSDIRLRINDTPFPLGPNGEPGFEGSARVIGYELDPGEGGDTDLMKLIFENPYSEDSQERFPS